MIVLERDEIGSSLWQRRDMRSLPRKRERWSKPIGEPIQLKPIKLY